MRLPLRSWVALGAFGPSAGLLAMPQLIALTWHPMTESIAINYSLQPYKYPATRDKVKSPPQAAFRSHPPALRCPANRNNGDSL